VTYFGFSSPKRKNNLKYEIIFKSCTKRDSKQLNIFGRKLYRIILGPVYENEKEKWRI
jgi:hypothetical protein